MLRLAAFILLLLPGCRQTGEILSAGEVASLFTSDRTLSFSRSRLGGTATVRADQTFHVTIPALGEDTGRWWLDGDRICSRWKQVRRGEELCARLSLQDDGSYHGLSFVSGRYLGAFRFTN